MSINQNTKAKGKTSILDPGISMADDIAAINQGLAERLPNNRYRINGRIYVDKGTGETFPESGAGVRSLARNQMGLLKVILKQGEWNDISAKMAERHFDTDDPQIIEVLDLFEIILRHQEEK